MNLPSFDPYAVVLALFFASALVVAVRTVWGPIKRFNNFTELLQRELTGWHDPASGEDHPSLRAELKELKRYHAEADSRLAKVEKATDQLYPNGGTHLADAIRDTAKKVDALESRVEEALKPKPRTRRSPAKQGSKNE